MLVAPTEPASLRALGPVSPVPEQYGADYLIHSPVLGPVGVQRKEIKDLVASVYDGRLGKEFAQMKALGQGILLIEGRVQWTEGGTIVGNYSQYTRSQHLGMLWSAQLAGVWIGTTHSLTETGQYLSTLSRWLAKKEHSGIGNGRPGPRGVWGEPDSKDWGVHLLTSFPGVGEKTAAAIWDKFDGVPLRWTVELEELLGVEGVGKVRAQRMVRMLNGQAAREKEG